MSSILQKTEGDLKLRNMSYVENMISNIELGTGVLLEDIQKPEFMGAAKGATKKMKSLSFDEDDSEDTKNVSLNYENYRSFFQYMRGVISDVGDYREELQKNSELKSKIEEQKLEREVTKYKNKINFKLWPWVVVSFILGFAVVFLTMFVIWYFSNGDSENTNTSNLYNDVFCGGCKKDDTFSDT